MKRITLSLTFALVVLFGAFSFAHAWPDQPPTSAFISGPGISGQVQITDPTVLAALRMGGLEDLNTGVVAEPVGIRDGYQITRYFEGSFRFADLTYSPGANGARSYVFFRDGAQLIGDHTPFNNHWLYATAQGDTVLRQYLDALRSGSVAPPLLARASASGASLIAYNSTTLQPAFILPNGLRSADGAHYYAAFDSMGVTTIHSFDVLLGTIQSSFALDGSWKLSAVSATGKWLALTQNVSEQTQAEWTNANKWQTNLAVLDTASGKLAQNITLDGKFDVDALDANGTALFVIEHAPTAKPEQYQVRLYDLSKNELLPGAIVDKREVDEEMVGYPWDAVATPDGTWLFTLYLNTRENTAFIHALNLRERYALCIDLPAHSQTLPALQSYALALSPNARTLYAVNSALGSFAIIPVGDADIARAIQFPPPAAASAPTAQARVSPDNNRVLFTDAHTVWEFDTSTNQIRIVLHQDKPILGFASHANDMLLANADHTLTRLNPVSASLQTAGQ